MNRFRTYLVLVALSFVGAAAAQPGGRTVEGDAARMQGRFLRGMAWYELGSAQAGMLQADAMAAWNQAVQADYGRYLLERAERASARKARLDELADEAAKRREALNTRWRENPTPEDVRSGVALNALAADLADPKFGPAEWAKAPVELPPKVTIPALAFRFADAPRLKSSTPFAAATVAVDRMKGQRWPVSLRRPDLDKARAAYQKAVAAVVAACAQGKRLQGPQMDAVREALFALKDQASERVPTSGGQRKQAAAHLERLDSATRIFLDRDFAEELIRDVEAHKAATVGQLLAFMKKYRLLFDDADEDPDSWAAYQTLHSLLKGQKFRLQTASDEPTPEADARPRP